jgi:hypothetical protein
LEPEDLDQYHQYKDLEEVYLVVILQYLQVPHLRLNQPEAVAEVIKDLLI